MFYTIVKITTNILNLFRDKSKMFRSNKSLMVLQLIRRNKYPIESKIHNIDLIFGP